MTFWETDTRLLPVTDKSEILVPGSCWIWSNRSSIGRLRDRNLEEVAMMLLSAMFGDSEVNLALEIFLRELHSQFGSRLLSVIVYGSLVHGDLAPGYGDLDFVAVVDGDLGPQEKAALKGMRTRLRSGNYGQVASMLEGAFLTRETLNLNTSGSGFWWGTTGERPIDRNPLGWLNSLDLRENGIVVFGADLRSQIPTPSREDIVGEISDTVRMIRREASDAGRYVVDWMLQIARFLVIINECRLTSKTEGALWAEKHAKGSWRYHLSDCSRYRRDAAYRARLGASCLSGKLARPLEEACDELESALAGSGRE